MESTGEILVEVKGVSKKFSRDLRRSLWYGVGDIFRAVLAVPAKENHLRKSEFWAVRNVSFELRRGECLGLIGRNGAGKSTLLKMLNGLIVPDSGSIVMHGKIGALIELGAGFNPVLTGRENIYNNGQLLGFTTKEIDEKLPAILEFAEIGEFINSPIQNYSSGMKVRLGFAIAAQMNPDVLIIDEVLAVGDLGFVLKCFGVIDKLLPNTAVIFVSHSMPQVSRICNQVVMMEGGEAVYSGSDIAACIDLYYSKFTSKTGMQVAFNRNDDGKLLGVSPVNETETGNAPYSIRHLDDLKLDLRFEVRKAIKDPCVVLTVYDKEQRPIGVCQSPEIPAKCITGSNGDYNTYSVKVTLPRINLSKGIYSIAFSITEDFRSRPVLRVQSAFVFQVQSEQDVWPPVEFEGQWPS